MCSERLLCTHSLATMMSRTFRWYQRIADLLERRPDIFDFREPFSALARSTGLWNYIDKDASLLDPAIETTFDSSNRDGLRLVTAFRRTIDPVHSGQLKFLVVVEKSVCGLSQLAFIRCAGLARLRLTHVVRVVSMNLLKSTCEACRAIFQFVAFWPTRYCPTNDVS